MDWWKEQQRRKNAECVFVINDGSGIWEIMCAERRWLSGEWEGAGDLLRPQPQSPVGMEVTDSLCVYTATHIYAHRFDSCVCTEHPCLWPSLLRSSLTLCGPHECASLHTFSSAPSLPLSAGSIYDIHLLPISWRFRFHQVSDEARLCFLKELGHSLTPSSYRMAQT